MTAHPDPAALEQGLAYAMHARLVAHYERHLVDECGYRSHEVIAEVVNAQSGASGAWLDLGAGSGLVGRALTALSATFELTAVDRSRAMLDLIALPIYVDALEADCNHPLPLPECHFQGALAAGLLEHLPEPFRFFANIARYLVPGGHLLFTYPPNHSGAAALADEGQALVSHDVRSIRAQLLRCGFAVTSEREYPAYRNGSRGWMIHRLVACRLLDPPSGSPPGASSAVLTRSPPAASSAVLTRSPPAASSGVLTRSPPAASSAPKSRLR